MSHNTAHHDTPDYKAIQELLAEIDAQFAHPSGSSQVVPYIDSVVDHEILSHVAQHHVHHVGPQYVGVDLVRAAYLPLNRIFIDAFLAGAKVQARRDANMFSHGGVAIPDTPEGL